jgi:hypothetical protein
MGFIVVLSWQLEDNCKLGSTDEVAAAAHQIFSSING